MAALSLHPQQLPKFKHYRNKRLEEIPLKKLEVSQPLAQKENENEPVNKDIEIVSKIDQEKYVEVQTMDVDFPSNLSEVWMDINLKIQQDQGAIFTDQQQIVHTTQMKSEDSFTVEPSYKLVSMERV